jgi:hypothetical protein
MRVRWWVGWTAVLSLIGVQQTAEGAGFRSPEECLAYTGETHLNCLYAYIEIQKDKLGKFESELNAQRGSLGHLREQVDRQASVTQELQRRLDQSASAAPGVAPVVPAPYYPPVAYGYPYPPFGGFYAYPPFAGAYGYPPSFGLGFYFGPRVYYGLPFYYRHRFFGPRIHRRYR